MIRSKKQMYIVVSAFAIILMLFTTTYAFFNYTRTGTANTIRTGRISFNTTQGENINLTNMFPIDASSGIPNDNTKVGTVTINVTGDTTYENGIEYLVTATNVQNTVGNKTLPISIDVSVESNTHGEEPNQTTTTLGTEDSDYFTNRGSSSETSIYKVLASDVVENNEQLVVGYIKSGATGVDGNIVIKAYLDKAKIAITDTYDEEESDNMGTTTEWVSDRTVFTTTEWNSLQTNGVSFQVKVEANEGIWVEEPPIPLGAYGDIKNNVITDSTIYFQITSSVTNGEGLYILPGTENDVYPIYYYRGNINDNNVIFGGFCWQMVRTTDTGGIKMIYNGVATDNGTTCNNATHATRVLVNSSYFNSVETSMSDAGYMSNKRYVYDYTAAASESIYGKNIEWHNDHYLVVDDTSGVASNNTTKDNYHHYSCGTATNSIGDTECVKVRYYYYGNYFIELENGELLEDAIYKMTGNGTDEVKAKTINQNYTLNENDSSIKVEIENWFKNNLTNEINSNNPNYQIYLEDTTYCNDRRFKTIEYNSNQPSYQNSGWNPNGGNINKRMYFATFDRYYNNWYDYYFIPSVECSNITDQFRVNNSVAKLNYPVGLLTADEVIMAGAAGGSNNSNTNYYLYTGGSYWTMSPSYMDNYGLFGIGVYSDGALSSSNHIMYSSYIRPVVSLKLGTEFVDGGDGTPTNPYVVKYN